MTVRPNKTCIRDANALLVKPRRTKPQAATKTDASASASVSESAPAAHATSSKRNDPALHESLAQTAVHRTRAIAAAFSPEAVSEYGDALTACFDAAMEAAVEFTLHQHQRFIRGQAAAAGDAAREGHAKAD